MATDLNALALRFCNALFDDTEGRPMQWRSAYRIGIRCSILNDQLLVRVVKTAIALGWIETQGDHSVSLTEIGRSIARAPRSA